MSLKCRRRRECFEHQFLVCFAVLGFGWSGLLDLREAAERHLPHAGRGGNDRGFLSDFECLLDVLLLPGHRGRRSLPDEAGWLKRSLFLATLPGHELLFGKAYTMVNSVCSAPFAVPAVRLTQPFAPDSRAWVSPNYSMCLRTCRPAWH